MNDLERRIRDRVDAFVEELTDLIRQAALESVKEALGSAESPPPRAKQKRTGRVVGKKRSGGKRSAEELARSEGAIATFVAKHPGARADQIAREMGVPTKDLALPIKKLLSRGELSTQGQKRATRYFAGKKR